MIDTTIQTLTPVPIEAKAYLGVKRVVAWPEDRINGDMMTGQAGYAVQYDNGYRSWSPAHVFEMAYRPLNELSFGHAWQALQSGLFSMARRRGWNGQDKDGMAMWVELQFPDAMSKMSNPYAFMVVQHGDTFTRTPWIPSQLDLFASDWEVMGGIVQ